MQPGPLARSVWRHQVIATSADEQNSDADAVHRLKRRKLANITS